MVYANEATQELPREAIDQLLREVRYGRLGLSFENEPYVVPVSHFYDGATLHFCIGKQGKTTTYLQANPQACFEVDDVNEHGWRSVICYGSASLSDSVDAKRAFFVLSGAEPPGDDDLSALPVVICTLALEEVTGRRSSTDLE